MLVRRSTGFRRGDRVLAVEGWIWECTSRCVDPADGTVPYQFTTFELMARQEARTATDALARGYAAVFPVATVAKILMAQVLVRWLV